MLCSSGKPTTPTVYGSINGDHAAPLAGIQNVHNTVDATFKAAIFGFSDGLTTSINLVLGVALAHQDRGTVVITGMAGLFAGASSMACGEWLSAQAESDSHAEELRRTEPDEPAHHDAQLSMAFHAQCTLRAGKCVSHWDEPRRARA